MENPRISTLIDLHYDFVQGLFCSERHTTRLGQLVLSDLISDPYYNHFCPNADFEPSSLPSVTEELHARDRQPALYVTPLSPIGGDALTGFSEHARDSWMLRATGPAQSAHGTTGIEVESVTGETREEFLSAFSSAYSSDDAVELYGPLEDSYVHALSRGFEATSPNHERFPLLARVGGKAVGVVVLLISGSYAAVYALGTVADARQHGVGGALMSTCSRIAFEAGASFLFLQVEAGTGAEKWYRKLGYAHAFHGTCYASEAPG